MHSMLPRDLLFTTQDADIVVVHVQMRGQHGDTAGT